MAADDHRTIAGLFIRRDLVYAIKTVENFGSHSISKHHVSDLGLNSADQRAFLSNADDPLSAIEEACLWIKSESETPVSIGVASYGPFKSLLFNQKSNIDPDYGFVLGHDSEGPISNISLHDEVLNHFADCKKLPRIIIQTDVAACGLGEFYHRRNAEIGKTTIQDTLVFLSFTEGVGGAIISKGNVMGGKHHSEMGQIPTIPIVSKDASKGPKITPFNATLEELASMEVFRNHLSNCEEGSYEERVVLTVQSFYIAQLCLSIAYVVAPTFIVVSTDNKQEELLARTRINFQNFIPEKTLREGWYEALTDGNELIQPPIFGSGSMGVCGAGAAGTLCLAAYAYRKAIKKSEH